jgi:septum formation protein
MIDVLCGVSMTTLVLASASQIRKQILTDAGFSVEVSSTNFVEALEQQKGASARAVARAVGKAGAVTPISGRWVLGCDQVAESDGVCFGKPKNATAHYQRLVSLRGKRHSLHCGYAIVEPNGKVHTGVEVTELLMRSDATDDEIAAYVAMGEGLGCAGGYAIEGHAGLFFANTTGDWNNILGLPLFRIVDQLRVLGWRYTETGFGVNQ